MASRQEEKERRRRERLEREQAEARAAARRKRIQLVGGGLLGLAAIAAVAFALITALGGDGGGGDGPRQAPTSANAAAKIPEQQTTDLDEAAKAAGCVVENPKFEGQNHADREFTAADYGTNPPTTGDHNPDWYEDGVYNTGDTPRLGELVHTLEHGRINVQYAPGTPQETVAQLETLVGENEGYHTLLFQNTTKMPYAVAATAWTHLLGCKEMNPQVFDAIRTFRDEYIDKGPEQVP
ncbi:MAG: DUF3105 domain-containing protein [Actinomycetota bacterium]|nr:DUF3105 domain-containing protein [Actinomycetota bacterium]